MRVSFLNKFLISAAILFLIGIMQMVAVAKQPMPGDDALDNHLFLTASIEKEGEYSESDLENLQDSPTKRDSADFDDHTVVWPFAKFMTEFALQNCDNWCDRQAAAFVAPPNHRPPIA